MKEDAHSLHSDGTPLRPQPHVSLSPTRGEGSVTRPSAPLAGAGLVLLSGFGFAAVAVLARVAFEAGSTAPTSLAVRFGLASGLFWLLLLVTRRVVRVPAALLVRLAAMGVLFSAGSVASFLSIEYIPASLSALLFYIYPAIVAAGSALFFRQRLSLARLLVLLTATAGCVLTVDVQSGAGPIDATGVALALAAPCFYSGYVLIGSRVTAHVAPLNASAWIITFAAIVIVLAGASGVLGDGFTTDVAPRGWAAMLGLAIFSTVISISAFLAGMARLDPFRASIISTVEPVITVILAALLLSERLTGQQALGGFVIVTSSAALQFISRCEGRSGRDA